MFFNFDPALTFTVDNDLRPVIQNGSSPNRNEGKPFGIAGALPTLNKDLATVTDVPSTVRIIHWHRRQADYHCFPLAGGTGDILTAVLVVAC